MKKLLVIFILLGFLTTGCASLGSLDKSRADFPNRTLDAAYSFPYTDVYKAVSWSCNELGLKIYHEEKGDGKIYAKSPWHWTSVGIYLTSLNDATTKVEIVAQKNLLLDIGRCDWRNRLLVSIKESLKNMHI